MSVNQITDRRDLVIALLCAVVADQSRKLGEFVMTWIFAALFLLSLILWGASLYVAHLLKRKSRGAP